MRVGVDVGGTFTDVVLVEDGHGVVASLKIASTPRAPENAVRDALQEAVSDPATVQWIGHATTIATNALLGQIGLELPRVALVTTEGFRDLVEIGRQNRPRVYDLFVERPKALVARDDRFTVRERVDFRGDVLTPLDEASVDSACEAIAERSIGAVAVCLLHSYANDAHERIVAERIRERCGASVVASAEANPEYREYERFSTALVSAALSPIVGRYLERLEREIRTLGIASPLYVMRSDGGMSDVHTSASRPASIVESGPAGGVIAAADLARAHGVRYALSFDMGGTTAKACSIIDGTPEIVTEYEAAGAAQSGRAMKGSGYPVRYPFVDLSEVSAGGGTIAWVDEARSLRVGPLSAGADPGPACYGRSERATVTDANVVLGRLPQRHLLGGAFPIDAARSREAIARLATEIGLGVEATAEGIVRIVDAQMAKTLRIVTIERGFDPRDFTIVAFGGNGSLHACALARELGIDRVLVPVHPGVFSAYGLLVADVSAAHVRPVLRTTRDVTHAELEAVFDALEEEGRASLRRQAAPEAALQVTRRYDARYRGQSFELTIEHDESLAAIERRFHDAHRRRYGYAAEDEAIELVNARSTVRATRQAMQAVAPKATSEAAASRRVFMDGEFVDVPVRARGALAAGSVLCGPAILEQYDCTTYVDRDWTARMLDDGTISMERGR